MLYKQAHANETVEEFFIEPEMALDMMLAADYLDLWFVCLVCVYTYCGISLYCHVYMIN